MSVYETMRRNRRLVWLGIVLGYLLAIVVVVVRIVNTESTAGELLGSLALGLAAAVAPTLALISLDRRPALLPAASLAAVFMGVIVLTLLPFWLLPALIWGWVHNRRTVRVDVSRARWWARVGLGLGVAIAVFILFSHPDPYCTQTIFDGTVSSSCASDTIVWWEAVVSSMISLALVGFALRWPVNAATSPMPAEPGSHVT